MIWLAAAAVYVCVGARADDINSESGCDKKATYVMATKRAAAPTWNLDTGRLRAQK